jgi:hypothetical protein
LESANNIKVTIPSIFLVLRDKSIDDSYCRKHPKKPKQTKIKIKIKIFPPNPGGKD